MDSALEDIGAKSVEFSIVLERKGSELAKKIKEKPWAQKLARKFSSRKDNNERRASMSEEQEDAPIQEAVREEEGKDKTESEEPVKKTEDTK
jgi:hypothetical protein